MGLQTLDPRLCRDSRTLDTGTGGQGADLVWSQTEQRALEELKRALTTAPAQLCQALNHFNCL